MRERRVFFHVVGTRGCCRPPIAKSMTDGGKRCGLAAPTQKSRNEGHFDSPRVQLVKNSLPPRGRIESGIECTDDQPAVSEPIGCVAGGGGGNNLRHRVCIGL